MADTDNIENIGNMLDNARTKFMRELDRYENLGTKQDLSKEKQESLFDKARTQYQENVRSIQRSDPATFQMWQDSQQERYVDTLNKLAFDSNPDLPYDEELGDELQYLLTMPYGSEAEKGLDLSETTTGFATPFFQNQKEVMVSMGADDPETVARHEGLHELTGASDFSTTKDSGKEKVYDTEYVARAFDYLRALVEGDEELANKTEQFVIRGSDGEDGGYTLLKLAIESIPQLYEKGYFDRDKATLDTAQKVVKQLDEDDQGFIDSILGKEPEKVKDPSVSTKDPLYMLKALKEGDEDTIKDLKELISVLPFSEKEQESVHNKDYYTIKNRSSIDMASGGLMADPLILSETAEEEAESKMGVGDYIEGAKELITDFSPAGTAQSMIDAAEEAYKLTTGAEDASLLDFGIAAIGALPGGKTATKAVETASKVADDVVEASQSIAKLDNYVPKKTVTAYKLVKERNGKFYPLFVGQGKEKSDFPVGEWIKAEAGELSPKGKVKSSIGELAYRPGFHAGDLPIATHIGGKSSKAATKPDYRPDDQVWVEIEMANDVDWGSEALKRAQKTKDGRIKSVTAHITDMVPTGGHYRYKTNPNMTGEWLIGGEMKVTRVLSDDEVKKLNEAAGVADLPRKSELDTASGLMSAEGAVKKSSPVDMAINVRVDKKADLDYAEKLISGEKVYETRNSRSLDPYIGKRVGIAKTGDGKAQAIGSVEIGEPIQVDEKTFRELQDKHLVPEGSAFDVPEGGNKYLYPVSNPERFETPKDVGRGIVSRKIVNKYAGGLMSDEYNRAES